MTRTSAIRILREHFNKSSTHKWKSAEIALNFLENEVNHQMEHSEYLENLENFKFQIEGLVNDFHASL